MAKKTTGSKPRSGSALRRADNDAAVGIQWAKAVAESVKWIAIAWGATNVARALSGKVTTATFTWMVHNAPTEGILVGALIASWTLYAFRISALRGELQRSYNESARLTRALVEASVARQPTKEEQSR